MSGADPRDGSLSPIDFSTHVLSLASSAMVSMGNVPAPGMDAPTAPDLETARHLIDVLAMLEIKTRGNLDESEQKLLQSLLYDLRVAFVDARAQAAKASSKPHA